MPKRARQNDQGESSLWLYAVTNPPPRRKACLQCFEAKVRCDHKRPVCSRCTRRAVHCDYTGSASDEPLRETTAEAFTLNTNSVSSEIGLTPSPGTNTSPARIPASPFPHPTAIFASSSNQPILPTPATPSHQPPPSDSDIHLICTVDAERVRDRWLEGWVPRPGQQPKNLSRGTATFIYGVLKTYPMQLCDGDLPPIIHSLQMEDGKLPEALANCASIARMWEEEEGGGSNFVRETTVREMERLDSMKHKLTHFPLLAAFQAYTLYTTLLLNPSATPVIPHSTMLTLQSFAQTLSLSGLSSPSEHPSSSPHPLLWRTWALAEAKRRSLIAMYMLDDVVNVFSNVSCILGDELAEVLAPCRGKMWEAGSEGVWRRAYDVYVGEWEGGGVRLRDLWGGRGKRVERWVRGVDGLGMVVWGVVAGTQYA